MEINLTPTASCIEIASTYRPGANGNSSGTEGPGPINVRTWGTPSECTAGALLVHGLGAHSGWFEAMGRRLKVRRVFAFAYDQVGFGKRRSQKFYSQEQWYEDLSTCFQYLSKMMGEKPVYILGNSMGAAVALKVVADGTVKPRGLVMFSPGFNGHPQTFNLPYRLSALAQALISPENEIKLPYTTEMVTRTEAARKWINKDPERRFTPSGAMILGLLKMTMELKKAKSVQCPIYMFKPGIDKIVDLKEADKVYQRLAAPDKKERTYSEAWHDLMFDPVLDELADEIASWISATTLVKSHKSV
jgi:alpha-beta hydrolase superfamily lysophospholipase